MIEGEPYSEGEDRMFPVPIGQRRKPQGAAKIGLESEVLVS